MEQVFFKALGANNSNNSNIDNKVKTVVVGIADCASDLYKEVMSQSRERKATGYDPNPLVSEEWASGNRIQRQSWTFDRFKIGPCWVEGETGPKDWTRHRTPHDTLTFHWGDDNTLAARIFYGLKEDRLLTEIYGDGEKRDRMLRMLSITDSKEYFRGGDSHDVLLDVEGNLWVANEALKESDSKESIDATQSILTLLWNPESFGWLAFGGSFGSYILFGDNTQVMCVDPHGHSRYFRWNQDLGKWIHYTTDLDRFLSVEFPEALPEELDSDDPDDVFDISSRARKTAITLFNAFKAVKKRKRSILSSRKANTLSAEVVANPNSVFLRMVEEGSSHETFAWGTDMEGKILVDEDAKRRLKPEWKDKVVICHEHFRREAPNFWTFPKGNVNLFDVLEDEAEVKSNTVYTGNGFTYIPFKGLKVCINRPLNAIDEWADLPKVDWERTFKVRPKTTIGDLKNGYFYCRFSEDSPSMWMTNYNAN